MGDGPYIVFPEYGENSAAAAADQFAMFAKVAIAEGKPITVETFFDVLRRVREVIDDIVATHNAGATREQRDINNGVRRRLKAELSAIEGEIHGIRKQPRAERERQLRALVEQFIEHRSTHLRAPTAAVVPVAPPDWRAIRELDTASSEPVVLKLETAFERGQFKTSAHADYPLANISGRVGNQDVTAHAELRSDLDTPEARAIMQGLADRLGDPRLGLGPRVQQTVQALMKFWLQSRTKAGFVSVTIQQLAHALGYQRDEHGYRAEVYEQIREYVETAARASLQVRGLPPLKEGTGNAATLTGAAYNFEYLDDTGAARGAPSKHWTAITFRPGSFLTLAADRDGALLKGFDPELNRLNPKNERGPLLLGKWLENQFRFNWNKSPGRIERRVRTLLVEGMGLSDKAASRASIETRNALEAALDRLEELGTVKAWHGDARWQTVDEQLEPQGGRPRRMTRGLWLVALESMVTIEAGQRYEQHYLGHGLTYQGAAVSELVPALREYLAVTRKPNGDPFTQADAAAALSISPSQLSKVLNGSKPITPQLAGRIETLIRQGPTLQLFGNRDG